MQKSGLKRKLGWLEAGFYVGGLALLGVFFQIRADSDRQRTEGIEAFEQAVEQSVELTDRSTGESLLATVAAPNLELWADKRIAEYRESLKVEAEAPLAVMSIDRLDIQVPVYNGADDFNLNRGVARIKGTAAIDDVGNLGIAGHRDGFFRGLKDIDVGDRIELQTIRGTVSYAVSSILIVDPSDVSVLADTEERTITLVTCYPFYFVGHAPKRFIVKAEAERLLARN
ncbi:MAG: class D sortase [Xanthomonadales bacterium]|nr:class D sortase [Gammaproteobacteria bacterium]NNJ65209.1 class D sortase [Xanthomonadales bacterium]NNK32800.1 class D sortase [Xanthomonadales bacterium]